ncbi:MAG: adenine nucleotide alpha hydrolase [Phycisphaeraceae bacterium]|nr:adenine nucleotide alpha hydrolase [Phycisphaeraceae bacterium]
MPHVQSNIAVDPSDSMIPTGRAFCSWSGGKDCCLALHEAVDAGLAVEALVTMLIETGQRSRSHGLHPSILQAQADAMGMRLHLSPTSWPDYETTFVRTIRGLAEQGLSAGVFGDIEGDANWQWELNVCRQAGVTANLPVWHRPRDVMMRQILDRGIEARIVAVRDGVLPPDLLGQTITAATLDVFARHGVDWCGENGEYHTVVVQAPLFRRRLSLREGERSLRDGVWFVDLMLES